jgi:hypothetical protein
MRITNRDLAIVFVLSISPSKLVSTEFIFCIVMLLDNVIIRVYLSMEVKSRTLFHYFKKQMVIIGTGQSLFRTIENCGPAIAENARWYA